MATDTQPVVEATKDQAKPGTEGTDARKADDLETLLAEYEATTKKPETAATKPETKTDTTSDDRPVTRKELDDFRRQTLTERVEREYAEVVELIKGDLPSSPRVIRGWLEEYAKEHPKLGEAYFNPNTTKADKQRIGEALKQEFRKENPVAVIDQAATEDRAAVTAAVRGASTKAPEGKAPDYSRMSPKDYGDAVEKQFGYRPQGT